MSVVYTLPPKSSRLFTCSDIISAKAVSGTFIINDTFDMFEAKSGYVYLISSVSFQGSMEQHDYIGAIVDQTAIPKISVINDSGVFVAGQPRSMVSFCADSAVDQWYSSDSGGKLRCRLSGEISQSAALVSTAVISFGVTLAIYEISSSELSGAFRDGIGKGAQNIFRGHL